MHLRGEALPSLKGALEEIQSVAGYDPQVIAKQWPSLAAFAILTAVGRA